MNISRIFLIVLDSFGVGELPDAEDFGDTGSNTLKAVFQSSYFDCPNMRKLGLFNIDNVNCGEATHKPDAAYCRLAEVSKGKDTTTGHWEICSLISKTPFPTYPNGFSDEILKEFSVLTGRGVLCNKPYSGTKVIVDYGKEHIESGKLIVYTSADSVFQIAAHEDIVPVEQLYGYCETARKILTGKNNVARVIARPFSGAFPDFCRTPNRRDFSVSPSGETLLNLLSDNGLDVIAVGKINDIFNSSGISEKISTHSNNEGMKATDSCLEKCFKGLCFVNLVDFDMLYGHRNDIDGYAKALSEFDKWLGKFIKKIKENDLLMITADHGCDPSTPSTDHSREYIPLMVAGSSIKKANLGTRSSFADIGKTIADIFNIDCKLAGNSFKGELYD